MHTLMEGQLAKPWDYTTFSLFHFCHLPGARVNLSSSAQKLGTMAPARRKRAHTLLRSQDRQLLEQTSSTSRALRSLGSSQHHSFLTDLWRHIDMP